MAKVSQTLRQSATDSASSSSSETNRAQATEPNQHVHSPDALVELKSARGFEHARKMTRKASALAEKKALKDPLVYWDLLLHKDYRDTRSVRPHMTMHVRGGWQLQLDDDGRSALEEETDWVAEVDDAPAAREVPLVDLLKPAKRRKTRRHLGDFEVVPSSRPVVALDDSVLPEPEPNEPWEYLDFDDVVSSDGAYEREESYAEATARHTDGAGAAKSSYLSYMPWKRWK